MAGLREHLTRYVALTALCTLALFGVSATGERTPQLPPAECIPGTNCDAMPSAPERMPRCASWSLESRPSSIAVRASLFRSPSMAWRCSKTPACTNATRPACRLATACPLEPAAVRGQERRWHAQTRRGVGQLLPPRRTRRCGEFRHARFRSVDRLQLRHRGDVLLRVRGQSALDLRGREQPAARCASRAGTIRRSIRPTPCRASSACGVIRRIRSTTTPGSTVRAFPRTRANRCFRSFPAPTRPTMLWAHRTGTCGPSTSTATGASGATASVWKPLRRYTGDHWDPNEHMPPHAPGSLAADYAELVACWENGPENTPGCDWVIPPAGECDGGNVGADYPYASTRFNRATGDDGRRSGGGWRRPGC